MRLSAYLDRIGFDGDLRPDLATLKALHRAHLLAIPYENLDVQLGCPLTTSPTEAFDKLVTRRRGGWCYEMNGVFGWALGEIGFRVTRLAADGNTPHSHLVLRVDLAQGPWIADVGFSDGPIEPWPLADGSFSQRGFDFRVELLDGDQWRFHNHRFGAAKTYDCGGPDEAAMSARCGWLQTDPESVFVQNALAFRHEADGHASIIGRFLRTFTPAGVEKQLVESADAYVALLRDRFALDLPEAARLWPRICARHEALFGQPA